MSDSPVAFSEEELVKKLNLKNPVVAGIFAWLVPGWGHYYQGRIRKAILFFLCIVPTFVIGCVLGSGHEVGSARNVYWSWRIVDRRLWFIPQSCIGLAAIPAGLQAWQVQSGQPPMLRSFMAPPQLRQGDKTGIAPTLDKIQQQLPLFELGTYLTVIAGLMNLLVIFDAIDGPLVNRQKEEKEKN